MNIIELSKINPATVEGADDTAPSVTRGANFIFESMRAGPEETGLHYIGQPYDNRKRDLEDIAEFMMFCREWWNALSQCHLGQSAIDGPKEPPIEG